MVLWHTRQYVHEELRGMDQIASRILSNSSIERLHLGSVLKNGLDADRIIMGKEHCRGDHHIHNDDSSSGE